METISLPYGREKQALCVEKSRLSAVLVPEHPQYDSLTEEERVQAALENPIESERLCELAKGKKMEKVLRTE